MSVTIPATHVALDERTTAIYRGRDILASQLIALADNANHAYALGARRTALSLHDVDVTADAAYVVVAMVPFTFAAGREAAGLQLVYACTNADLRVTVRNAANSATLGTLTDATGTVVTSGTILAIADADVLIKVEAQEHSGAGGTLDMLHVYELAHTALTLPNVVPVPDLVEVAQAAGLDHIWSFDNAGTPTEDVGDVGGGALTVTGTVTSVAPTVTGSRGYMDQATQASTANRMRTTAEIDIARTADCWWEGVVQTPDPITGSTQTIIQIGGITDPNSFATLRWNSGTGVFDLLVLPWTGTHNLSLTTLTDTYLSTPTYVAIQWNHSASTFTVYWNNGGGEGSATSLTHSAGSAGTAYAYIGGDPWYQASTACKYHYAAFHRGTITSGHRNAIYAALGW